MDERKIYYSFHEMPPAYSYENNYGKKQGIRFSEVEIRHIFIAIAVLTIAFAFALAPSPPLYYPSNVVSKLPISFIAIVTAFFCHEMAHKYVGQKYGYWSEFRMFPQGLMFALFLGIFLGVVFAAPGAVIIAGAPSKQESGRISVAGPATNIFIAAVFFVLASLTTVLTTLFFSIALINAFLAFFNLLPFGPLDGLKVFTWNKSLYGVCLVTSLLFLTFAFIYLS